MTRRKEADEGIDFKALFDQAVREVVIGRMERKTGERPTDEQINNLLTTLQDWKEEGDGRKALGRALLWGEIQHRAALLVYARLWGQNG